MPHAAVSQMQSLTHAKPPHKCTTSQMQSLTHAKPPHTCTTSQMQSLTHAKPPHKCKTSHMQSLKACKASHMQSLRACHTLQPHTVLPPTHQDGNEQGRAEVDHHPSQEDTSRVWAKASSRFFLQVPHEFFVWVSICRTTCSKQRRTVSISWRKACHLRWGMNQKGEQRQMIWREAWNRAATGMSQSSNRWIYREAWNRAATGE